MSQDELILGIDLGTTNSEVAAFVDGRVQVLGPAEGRMLPSCVGIAPDGELLVGQAARNQQLVYPERTVRSIKRRMGSETTVTLGDRSFTPPEISALILRALAGMAERQLGQPARKAVITVPAYFSDAQRSATREAGALAGLEVVRILNEPTAASLAYGYGGAGSRTVLIYDLGGGTFDVSIVRIEGDVTEVLASHGDNQLGGDDFDQLLVERLARAFEAEHGIDLRSGHAAAHARLWRAAEAAKRKLSFEPYARVREENLASAGDGAPRHLDHEIALSEYEALVRPRLEATLDSVARALGDAQLEPAGLDAVILVGGSTRTPLVARLLEERTGLEPRREVHPDLCVALGAGVLASRLAGRDVERVLVDVSPYSFGPSYLGERGGAPYPHCYHPIIHRNTPLPVTRTESYYTVHPGQTTVEMRIYQGEDPDALRNILIGDFKVEGLTPREEGNNEVLCRMSLDLDGILEVTATEKLTGKSRRITIEEALRTLSDAEVAAARERLESLWSGTAAEPGFAETEDDDALGEDDAGESGDAEEAAEWEEAVAKARRLVERCRERLESLHDEDREEAVDFNQAIETAIAEHDAVGLARASTELAELLFFVEGR